MLITGVEATGRITNNRKKYMYYTKDFSDRSKSLQAFQPGNSELRIQRRVLLSKVF